MVGHFLSARTHLDDWDDFGSDIAAHPTLPVNIFPDLTDSERKVLNLMARGASNEAIAQQLSFTQKTVRNYVSNIFSKLQVADQAQAIIKAREAGVE